MPRTMRDPNRSRDGSLSKQIVLLLLCFAVLPMLLLTATFHLVGTSLFRREVARGQVEAAERVSQSVQFRMQKGLEHLRLLARWIDPPARPGADVTTMFWDVLALDTEFESLALVRTDGKLVFKLSPFHTYLDGELGDVPTEDAFNRALKGIPSVGGVTVSSVTHFPMLRLYVPVMDRSGLCGVVLCAEMNVSRMWGLVARSFADESTESYIVDRDGILIAFESLSAVLDRRDMKHVEGVRKFLENDRAPGDYRGIRGSRVMGVAREVPLTGWGVVVETRLDVALRHYNLLISILAAFSVGMILCAAGLGWWFCVRKIVRPIRAIQEDVRVVASGNLDHRIRTGSGDELGLLAADLGVMVENLRETTVSKGLLLRENEERRKTEEALRRSERNLADVIDFLPDATFAIDINKRVIVWNRAMEEMTGIPGEAILGKGDHVYTVPFYGEPRRQLMDFLVDGDDHRDDWERYPVIAREGSSIVAEVFAPSLRGGTGAWIYAKASFLHDHEGRVVGAIESVRDLTERKRSEVLLRESEEKMRSVFRAAPIGIGVVMNRVIMDLNVRACEMTGYERDELVGRTTRSLYASEEDFERIKDAMLREIADSGTGTMETRWRRKDGTIMDVLISTSPIDVEDTSRGVTFTALDITGLKAAQQALRDSEAKLRTVINSSPDIICLKDARGAWIEANESILRLYGIQTADYRNMTDEELADLAHPACRDSLRACVETDKVTWKRGISSRSQETIPDRDGGTRIYDVIKIPLFKADGSKLGLVVYGRDITDLKRAEDEKDRLQEQLLHARKMESVGRLAGGVAHDFNNKLQAILGYADMALGRFEPGSPPYEWLMEIRSAASHSADLTRQLLAFARRQPIRPRVLDLNETVSGMLKMLQRLIGEEIELGWIPGRELWNVRMDPTQIDQVLANLVVNARDAIPGAGSITIETRNVRLDEVACASVTGAVPGEYVRLGVGDNGEGMKSEVLDRIFEPFFTTKEIGRGTGLGLATVYGIVKQNEGFIRVQSEVGRGTTFFVHLPRHGADEVESVRVPEARLPEGGTETVLIVEDDEAILNLAKAILDQGGYAVLAAKSPAEALALAESHDGVIHLILTDVVMPEMNGRELVERLSASRPAMKSLFMSGYTSDMVVLRGVEDESLPFIQKPFSVHDLLDAVRNVLDR